MGGVEREEPGIQLFKGITAIRAGHFTAQDDAVQNGTGIRSVAAQKSARCAFRSWYYGQ